MKVEDLITAIVGELEYLYPKLDGYLDHLATLVVDSDGVNTNDFEKQLSQYCHYLKRIVETAEIADLSGLYTVLDHLLKNALALSNHSFTELNVAIDFLRSWPSPVIAYLKELQNPQLALDVVSLLKHAPMALSAEDCLLLMYELGGLSSPAVDDTAENARPVLASDDTASLHLSDDVDTKLLESFVQDALEKTASLIAIVSKMRNSEVAEYDELKISKRFVHTLKGSSAIFGLSGMTNICHHFEDVLEYFEKQESGIPDYIKELMLDTVYCLAQMVSYINGQDDYPSQSKMVLQDVLDLANRIDKGEDIEHAVRRMGVSVLAENTDELTAPKERKALSSLRIATEKINELFRLSSENMINAAAMDTQIKQVKAYSIMQNKQSSPVYADSDEQFNQSLEQLTVLQNQYRRVAKDLQLLIIDTRMTEVSTLESRLQRTVRTTCQSTGKTVRLILSGGNTLIDSDVLKRLSEPLLHLLRNAVDHGIELPEERLALGKSEQGTIQLNFSRDGQKILLQCKDDGRGLNIESIKQQAIEKKLIGIDDKLSDEELAQLVLHPGFSTREKVSTISGRGVGLDIVTQWARSMSGDVKLNSKQGQGTEIELSFSAVLSTSQVLIVEVADQFFALSSSYIEQVLHNDEGEFIEESNELKYKYKTQSIKAYYLIELLGLSSDSEKKNQAYSAVIISYNQQKIALAVNTLVDSTELLIKDPDRYTRHIKAITGISILSDGEIVAHIDITELIATPI